MTGPSADDLARDTADVMVHHRTMLTSKPVVLRSVAPVFSTTDVARWLEHYRRLRFTVEAHDESYG